MGFKQNQQTIKNDPKIDQFESRLRCPQASRFRGHKLNSFSALRGAPLNRHVVESIEPSLNGAPFCGKKHFFMYLWGVELACGRCLMWAKPAVQHIHICCEVIIWAKFGVLKGYYLGQARVIIWAKFVFAL